MSGESKRINGQQRSGGWTAERRAKQAAAIRRWKPWEKAGVKTAAGKEISRMNAYKHGGRSAVVRHLAAMLSIATTDFER